MNALLILLALISSLLFIVGEGIILLILIDERRKVNK